MDFAFYGSLRTHMKNVGSIDEYHTRYYSACLVSALEFIHENGILHRDVNPKNILIAENRCAKLADFGAVALNQVYGTDARADNVGTLPYRSPEDVLYGQQSFALDWWGLGITMYEMLTSNVSN